MNITILRKIGLTEGEIRVYEAVLKLGKSSTGPIMDTCGISSSKVYLILEKLIQKGFVTYTIENNVKRFFPTNPINILEYITRQQEALAATKQQAQQLTQELTEMISSHKEETVKVYKGTKSMTSAFQNIIDELSSKEPFLFLGAPLAELDALQMFFRNLHAKRESKHLRTLGLVHASTKKKYQAMFKSRKQIQLKFTDFLIPHAVAIGTTQIIISLWDSSPIGFEIQSERIAQRYRTFFMHLWKTA